MINSLNLFFKSISIFILLSLLKDIFTRWRGYWGYSFLFLCFGPFNYVTPLSSSFKFLMTSQQSFVSFPPYIMCPIYTASFRILFIFALRQFYYVVSPCSLHCYLSFLEFTELLESINLYSSPNVYSKDVLYPGGWRSILVKYILQPGILAVSSKGLLMLY